MITLKNVSLNTTSFGRVSNLTRVLIPLNSTVDRPAFVDPDDATSREYEHLLSDEIVSPSHSLCCDYRIVLCIRTGDPFCSLGIKINRPSPFSVALFSLVAPI